VEITIDTEPDFSRIVRAGPLMNRRFVLSQRLVGGFGDSSG
jgi:hypothetical protein